MIGGAGTLVANPQLPDGYDKHGVHVELVTEVRIVGLQHYPWFWLSTVSTVTPDATIMLSNGSGTCRWNCTT